jgi:predicted ATPase/DNA-binding winged helix-turn-helix (wHTH) protein
MITANAIAQQVSAATAKALFDPVPGHAPGHGLAQRDAGSEHSFSFGPYRLFPRQRLLLKAGKPLHIGSKALEILILLAERQGDLVSKKELMAHAWPGVTVEEGGLRVHVAGLRKALGDGIGDTRYIKNIPGRGYCFVAPASRGEPIKESDWGIGVRPDHTSRLPLQLDRMVGRTDAVHKISDLLEARRFVTVHGPGGVGKTATAVSVGHAQLASFAGAVHFLDLGQITEPHLLPGALASVLGLSIQSGDPTPGLLAFLRDRRVLLIFDSCEHLIESVATLTERIFHEAPEVSILATSREVLRVEGEHVYRLSVLECPLDADEQSAERVLSFAAPRLFVKRVVASGYQFELTDADAPVVARICRKLDGLALAINVAAAQAGTFGLGEIAYSLESKSWLLWRGRRTALPRHQTIAATLDWSYGLLSEAEQAVLRRLSIFKGFFTLDAAREIARHGSLDPSHDLHIIDKLIAKSLISFEVSDGVTLYRLLHSTRAYALEKLRHRGEFDEIPVSMRDILAG